MFNRDFFNGNYCLKIERDDNDKVHVRYSFKDDLSEGEVETESDNLVEAMEDIIDKTAEYIENQNAAQEETEKDDICQTLVDTINEKDQIIDKLIEQRNKAVAERNEAIENARILEEQIDNLNINAKQQENKISSLRDMLSDFVESWR